MDVSATCLVDMPRYVYARTQFGKTWEESFAPCPLAVVDTVEDAKCGAMGEAVNGQKLPDVIGGDDLTGCQF